MMACSTSYAASFDCNKASSDVGKMICSDHKLSRLDDCLSQNYKIAMSPDMPEGTKSNIRESQIDWLNKRNACTNGQCILSRWITVGMNSLIIFMVKLNTSNTLKQ